MGQAVRLVESRVLDSRVIVKCHLIVNFELMSILWPNFDNLFDWQIECGELLKRPARFVREQ